MKLTQMTRALGVVGLSATIAMSGCSDSSDSSAPTASVPTGPTAMAEAAKIGANTNNPTILWDTLPLTWRGQANELVHAFAGAVPAPLYDNAMAAVKKLATVLKTKKQFVLATPFLKETLAEPDAPSPAQFDKFYEAITSVVEAVANSDLKTTTTLGKTTVAKLLTEIAPTAHTAVLTIATVVAETPGPAGRENEQAKEFLALFDSIKHLTATVVSRDKTTAVISITLPNLPPAFAGPLAPFLGNVQMTEVDGEAWVPAVIATEWPQMIASIKEGIDQMAAQFGPDNPQAQQQMMGAQMVIGMMTSVLDQLEKASTQKEFDQALLSVAGLMGGMGPMLDGR